MASTIDATTNQTGANQTSHYNRKHTPVYVSAKCKGGAAQTPLTIYTVPKGQTLVITKFRYQENSGAAYYRYVYDNIGDSATGTVLFIPAWGAAMPYVFEGQVEVKIGITLQAIDADLHYICEFQGYLVGDE